MDDLLRQTLNRLQIAEDWGFVWSDYKPLLTALISEVHEIEEVIQNQESSERLIEEIGDLLLGCLELCRYVSVPPEQALAYADHKFAQRFDKMKELLAKEGKQDLHGERLEKKLALWKQAKLDLAS
jgi:uncharacterized protein YabN with tetrapyrrole methylase and pyrophosphatase domain